MYSERFAADKSFPENGLAALLLSKVFFHLENWQESIRFALISGPLFDISLNDAFTKTILTKAIDLYVADRAFNTCHSEKCRPIDPALESIVELLIKNCLEVQDYKQVIGIALDSCRMDVLQATLTVAQPINEHLRFAQKMILAHAASYDFQHSVLELLVSVAEKEEDIDYIFICDCLVSTNNVLCCGTILTNSVQSDKEDNHLLAYQIAFNTYEVGPEFAQKVCQSIMKDENYKSKWTTWENSAGEKLYLILSGRNPCDLIVKFLAKANSADLLILERSRESLNIHNSQHHSAIYYANGLMHCGSTNDEFLRKNMEWLSYASNWAKFSAAASLGMIHRGHIETAKVVLAPYLPRPGSSGSAYAEGGALFALGLIHSKAEPQEVPYLREQLSSTTNETIQHGACLGLGAAAMATLDQEVLDDLRGVLYGDNAVAGEAAALAIGLVMVGSIDIGLVEELLQYARETQHEKIIRGISLAIALIMYGSMDKAETVIEAMMNDKDVVIRFGGIWTISMAYAGSSENLAVSKLLHAAVSESDDDVRRAAVIGLGFVLFKNASELPQLLELLAGSYNPHVRYGVALALGIAFCGTANKEAIDLIKPMCKDMTDFVRQGAYMALSMILMQVSEAQSDQVSTIRKLLENVAGNKYEDAIARFGAILSQGIIDAGGRNSIFNLSSPSTGHPNMISISGMMMFCQFWYWYPCIGFASLALQPTAMIGVDGSLGAPKFEFTSAASPKLFAYPEAIKPIAQAQPKKLTTAVLSTTAKAVARAKKSGKATLEMEIEPSPALTVESAVVIEPEEIAVVAEEPTFGLQSNFSRITLLQRPHILFGQDSHYLPISGVSPSGQWTPTTITVVRHTDNSPVEYLNLEKETEESVTTDDKSKEPEQPTTTESKEVEMAPAPEPFEEPEL